MRPGSPELIIFLAASLTAANPLHAISTLSLDAFATTSEGWQIGGAGVQPTWNGGTGQDGASGFLIHFSDAGGANGKWLMRSSLSEWLGNYTAAGVTGITLWADNAAGSPLGLRIAFDGPGGWFYSAPQTITNSTGGADWTPLTFNLAPVNFTHATGSGGTADFASTMGNVTRFEIFGGAGPVIFRGGGDLVEAGTSSNTVRVDNISAIPEPSALALGIAGFALAATTRRRSPTPSRGFTCRLPDKLLWKQ